MYDGSVAAKRLILAAALVAAVVTAVIAGSGWTNGDGMVITFYGVPLLCACLFAFWIERGIASTAAPLAIGAFAVGLLVLSSPLAGGTPVAMTADLLLPVAPLVLLVAALVSWRHRRALPHAPAAA